MMYISFFPSFMFHDVTKHTRRLMPATRMILMNILSCCVAVWIENGVMERIYLSLALGKLINFFLSDSWKLFEMSFFMIQFDIKKVLMMKAKRQNKTFYSYHHPSLLVVVWTLSNKCVNNPLFDLFFAPFEINIYWPKACAFGYFPLSLFIDFPSPLQQPTHNRFNDD